MDKISVRLGGELASQAEWAIKEFGYHTRTDFVRDAVRLKVKELNLERKKENAWHKLLSTHRKIKETGRTLFHIGVNARPVQRRYLTLKDLLRHHYNHFEKEEKRFNQY